MAVQRICAKALTVPSPEEAHPGRPRQPRDARQVPMTYPQRAVIVVGTDARLHVAAAVTP
jgi:hypothetical protein